MRWTFAADLAEFPAAAEEWLLRDTARNTVPLTVLARRRQGLWNNGALLGWLTSDDGSSAAGADAGGRGQVRGVVMHTPPNPVVLTDIPAESVRPLAEALRTRAITRVSGPAGPADAFAAASGHSTARRMAERLYRLGTLVRPALPGRSRRAVIDDLGPLVDWVNAFAIEADAPGREADPAAHLKLRIDQGELVLWEDEHRAVSLAGFSTPIAGMSRVGPVYTPPEARRRGYGAAVTYAATVAAREAGAGEILLFTDLANPTSNSIYQALGYRPVADHATITFE